MDDTQKIAEEQKTEALAQLVKELGIDSLPQDKQNELVIKMTEVLLQRIFLETMEKLGEQGRAEYEKMTVGEIDGEQVEAFFKEKIKDYDLMVQEIVEKFKGEMMQKSA